MYESFKNFELLRHQVSTRIGKSIKDYSDENKNNADNISSTIFSACFSLVTAYVGNGPGASRIKIFLQFIVAYIVAFFVYKYLAQKIRKVYYNTRRHGGLANSRETKERIDNFDHIACDNNLIAKEFKQKYENVPKGTEADFQLSTFEFYELYYYTKTSAEATLSILDYADTCVNTLSEKSRVDLHRIYNQLDMLCTAKNFLLEHSLDEEIHIDKNLRFVLIDQIHDLDAPLQTIKDKCDEFKNFHFSDLKIQPLRDKYSPHS